MGIADHILLLSEREQGRGVNWDTEGLLLTQMRYSKELIRVV